MRKDRPVLVTVSGTMPAQLHAAIEAGRRPRADYLEIAAAAGADVLDRPGAVARLGRAGPLLQRVAGANVVMAIACALRRPTDAAVLTDGEQVGIPFAAITRFRRARPRHVMIGHRLSARKKVLLHRVLRLERVVDRVVVYSSEQRRVAIEELRYPAEKVVLHPFMVDTEFFRPEHVTTAPRARPLICAVGQELRDYPTFVDAVRGLDVDVVVASASPWSKREDTAAGIDTPDNVVVAPHDLFELRDLYARAALVVVPLQETDFQAGITTILEGMAMGRPVVCTRTAGQTDTIVDGETGRYVPPADPRALREAIVQLLDDPTEAARLGAAGQRWVRANAAVDGYATDIAALLTDIPAPKGPGEA
jgi:glycosyltransferase involved in cell wall biosynthesis